MNTITQRRRANPVLAIAVAVGVAIGFAVVATPTTSTAQVSGENGRIAFTSSLIGDDQIVSAKPDGSDFSQLTLQGDSYSPDWSPNGSKLAYSEEGSLKLMNANGTGTTTLMAADNDLNYSQPSWSPDGAWITYVQADFNRRVNNQPEVNYTSLWKVRADGTQPPQRLYQPNTYQVAEPRWSPSGNSIGVIMANPNDNNTQDIYRLGTDGSNPQVLLQTSLVVESSFDWSPNGQQLVVSAYDFVPPNTGERRVYLTPSDGTGPLQPIWGDAWDAAWSPDGTRVVAAAEDPNSRSPQLVTLDPTNPATNSLTGLLGHEPTWQPLQGNDPNNPLLVETTLAVDAKTTDKKLKAGKRYKLVREALTNGSITKTKVVCKVRGKKVKGSKKKSVCKPKIKTPQTDTAKIKAKPTCNSKVRIRVIVQAKYQDADPAKFKRTYKVKGKSGPSCPK